MIEQDHEPGNISETGNIDAHLKSVRERVATAARAADRDPDEIELIAVSKAQPISKIEAALQCGQRVFGENYVQEAQSRWPALRDRYDGLQVHMIGPLQTNKAGLAVQLFDAIQTVDRAKLARALAKEMQKQQKRLPVLIQVNTGEEPQKSGVLPSGLGDLVNLCVHDLKLDVGGLMAIPPADQDSAMHAALLNKLARRYGLKETSIGMSGDYETAIGFGATIVRVGAGIFGARQNKP